jgi:methylated-DNA-[protein]-cysteine S-methyltransferase
MNTDPVFGSLDPSAADLATLQARLATAAAPDTDVAYITMNSPIGELLLAATDVGLVRVAFQWADEDPLQELADTISPRILRSPKRLRQVAQQLEAYFDGTRRHFDLPFDMRLSRGFRREVLQALQRIDYGATASYADVAFDTGRPRAVRAVGTACGMNPLPVVIPCHRVIRSDGSLGQYGGGTDVKRALLELEGALDEERSAGTT